MTSSISSKSKRHPIVSDDHPTQTGDVENKALLIKFMGLQSRLSALKQTIEAHYYKALYQNTQAHPVRSDP